MQQKTHLPLTFYATQASSPAHYSFFLGAYQFLVFGLLRRHTAINSITTEMHTSGAQ